MLQAITRSLRVYGALGGSAALAVFTVYITNAAPVVDSASSPIYGVTVPPGYRDWKVISIARLKTDKLDQLRAQLGNDVAIKAFKEGKLPFPDGSMIAALHWSYVPSEENDKVLTAAFPGAQSFVAGAPVNVQFMVKDSKKYAGTGGWGFADSRVENLATERCTKPASPAISLPRITTSCLLIMPARPELAPWLSRLVAA